MDKHEINFKLDPKSASVLTIAILSFHAKVHQMLQIETLTNREDHLDWLKRLRQMQSDLREAIIQAHREGGTS